MNDLPVNKLTALTKHFGNDLLNDFARCDELLSDFCVECRLEVNLLISALREGCAKELQECAPDAVVANDVYVRLVGQLQKNTGIMAEYAEWGVKGLATALGLEVKIPVRQHVPPPQPMTSLPVLQEQTAQLHPQTDYKPLLAPVNMATTIPRIVEAPTSIPPEHYAAVCNILLKSGSEWKDPSIWAKIDSDVKQLCANSGLSEQNVRNIMRLTWPSVEKQYEEEKTMKELEVDLHNRPLKLLMTWMGNIPDGEWNYDHWDDFIATLEQPFSITEMETYRDNAVIYHDEYSVQCPYCGRRCGMHGHPKDELYMCPCKKEFIIIYK